MWKAMTLSAALCGLAWLAPVQARDENPAKRPARPTLGLRVEPPSPESDQRGLTVGDVVPNGPAAKAGVQPGDVIVKLDDRAVSDFDSLVNSLAKHKAGDK